MDSGALGFLGEFNSVISYVQSPQISPGMGSTKYVFVAITFIIPLPVIASHSLRPPCPCTLGEENPERINYASIFLGSRWEPGRWLRGLTLWVTGPSGLG